MKVKEDTTAAGVSLHHIGCLVVIQIQTPEIKQTTKCIAASLSCLVQDLLRLNQKQPP